LDLANSGFGQFHCDPQIDLPKHTIKAGIARCIGQPFRSDLQARQRRLIDRSVEQAKLEFIKHIKRVSALGNRTFFALSASSVEIDRSVVAAGEFGVASCSLTVKVPPSVRRAVSGAVASAVPFGP
jgi:hypothetical protein